jgi:hypothetical protein
MLHYPFRSGPPLPEVRGVDGEFGMWDAVSGTVFPLSFIFPAKKKQIAEANFRYPPICLEKQQ